MKKFVLLFILLPLCIFSACTSKDEPRDNMITFDKDVYYDEGVFFDKNWNETIGTYKEAVVPNKETALEIAKAIFNGMEKTEDEKQFVPQSVFYDEQDEIWIVSFWKDSSEYIVGGGCSIAIQKADGKVLRIWFGE